MTLSKSIFRIEITLLSVIKIYFGISQIETSSYETNGIL